MMSREIELTLLPVSGPPVPRRPGNTGCGESLCYGRIDYHYRVGKHVPRDRVVHLTNESNYCGRQRGDFDYIVVAWDGVAFRLLEHCYDGLRRVMEKYEKLTPSEAIAKKQSELTENHVALDALVKCGCGQSVLLLDDDQPAGVCFKCFRRGHGHES